MIPDSNSPVRLPDHVLHLKRNSCSQVASLSLADDWQMRFRPRKARPYVRHGTPGDWVVTLPRRSVLVLRGPAHDAYMHGIASADTAACVAAVSMRCAGASVFPPSSPRRAGARPSSGHTQTRTDGSYKNSGAPIYFS